MTSDSTVAAGLCWSLLPLLYAALLNAAHTAAICLDDSVLRQSAEEDDSAAKWIVALLSAKARTEPAVALATMLSLLLSGRAASLLLARWAGEALSLWALLPALLAFSTLFAALGVEAPRRLAGFFPQPIAYALAGLLRLTGLLLRPLVLLIDALGSLAVRASGKNPGAQLRTVTEEEIRMLVDQGEERGAIEELEKEMINNIFEFDDRDVSEVMTHRTEVAAVPVTASLEEVAALSLETGYSRIPVYEEDIDSVIGVVYAKDLLKYLQNREGFTLLGELRRPIFVPETCSCADAFALLQREKTQIAVVVDEYGGTYGIITMEDLLESIVGNIQDEYDNERDMATEIGEGVYVLDGSMGLAEAERLLDFEVPDTFGADTLGGFVTELLSGVPRKASDPHSAVFDGVTFTVLHADEKRIDTLRAAARREEE